VRHEGGCSGHKSAKAVKLSDISEEQVFKKVKLCHHGKPGINTVEFLTSVSENLKARLSTANTDLRHGVRSSGKLT